MNFFRYALVLIALVMAHVVHAQTILIFGDSLSAAYGIAKTQSWTELLQQRLVEQGYPHQIQNASISGETTAGGNSRLAKVLQQSKANIVILELGGNDGLRGLPVDAMQNNLDNMIRISQAHKAKVLLVGVRIPPNYGNAYVNKFTQVYVNLAKKYGVALLADLLHLTHYQDSLFQTDRIHPTAAAQPLVLEAIWEKLKPLLE